MQIVRLGLTLVSLEKDEVQTLTRQENAHRTGNDAHEPACYLTIRAAFFASRG